MFKKFKSILLYLTIFLLFFNIPLLITNATQNLPESPNKTETVIVTYNDPKYNKPKFVFDVKFNGLIILKYNWTDNIGHSCNAMWFNFWDHDDLTKEEQESEGNLGMIWMTKCDNNYGIYNFTIDNKVLSTKTKIFFELDNDQMFTGTLQDPIILKFDFYRYTDQINFLAIYLPIFFGWLSIIGFMIIKFAKK